MEHDNVPKLDPSQYTILVVDDNPTNLKVIINYLREFGFKLLIAKSGPGCFKISQIRQPDLILLDVMMPGMDGFEVCRRLKNDETTVDIPIIFMTSLDSEEDKVRGFDSGAVDYVIKPVQQREVLARVTTHLQIKRQALLLQNQAKELQNKNKQLADLNNSKDRFFSILAHDLKGPFMPVLTISERLSTQSNSLSPNEVRLLSDSIHDAAEGVYSLLENLLQWSRLQMGRIVYQPDYVDLYGLISRNIALLAGYANDKGITLSNKVSKEVIVNTDENILNTIIRNLINNALKFTPTGGLIEVSTHINSSVGDWVELWVKDTGVGISTSDTQKLFQIDMYHTTLGTNKEGGTGLGLILCKEMVDLYKGKIWVESNEKHGAIFKFTIPLIKASQPTNSTQPDSNPVVKEIVTASYNNNNALSPETIPSKITLDEGYILAKRGSLHKIKAWATAVEQDNSQYKPFTDKLKQLAEAFEGRELIELFETVIAQSNQQ